jgi:hypothetical protein
MSDTTEQNDERNNSEIYHWQDRGRATVGDENNITRLARLTAYAEYGEEALEADHVHHALAATELDDDPIRVNAPGFLIPLGEDEHRDLHADAVWREDDGIPQLLPDDEVTDPDEGRDDVTATTAD